MEMELYNTTDKTKVIPKFNYGGKMIMKPHESIKIEDYMTSFFKPYARTGIVVRPIMKMKDFTPESSVEPEVEEVINVEPVTKVEEPVLVEDSVDNADKEEFVEVTEEESIPEDIVEPIEEVKKVETEKYTKDKLSSMSVKNLRLLADDLGVDLGDVTKKADIIESILKSQDK